MANPTLVIAGTPETVMHKPVDAGGTVLETSDNNDLQAAPNFTQAGVQITTGGLQGGLLDNPFQTLNLFLGEFCRVYTLAPLAAIRRVEAMLLAMKTQFYN
jgi:hypothetical protein